MAAASCGPGSGGRRTASGPAVPSAWARSRATSPSRLKPFSSWPNGRDSFPVTPTVTSPGPRISAAAMAARETLAAGREKLRRQHDSGSPGVQVCAHFTDLLDEIVVALFRDALAQSEPALAARLEAASAIVALGGFGRREMAPYSDVDVMLLHGSEVRQEIRPLVRRFSQNLYDTGMEIGFTARTPGEACQAAFDDATVLTSLAGRRWMAGSQSLYDRFDGRLRRLTRRRWRRLLRATEIARREERGKYGETNFLLEPNVKRSRGGLRDLQFIRWIGFIRCGENDFDALAQLGWLTREEQRSLRAARDFLLWLRNDLHFASGKANDVLDRGEQLRLAELRSYPAAPGLLPVEHFMREYFQHTSQVREIASHLAAGARPRPLLEWLREWLASHRFDGDFRVGWQTISVAPSSLPKLKGDLAEVLRLLDIANLHDKRISHETWQATRCLMLRRGPANPELALPNDVSGRFWSLLSQPARLGELLRRLHDLRVLEQLVPAMTHARGLLQFNAYHSYTVDEHSIRVVEHLTALQTDDGVAGEVYRSIKNKSTLHLAGLLHDLGKGYGRDHSEGGAQLGAQSAARMGP